RPAVNSPRKSTYSCPSASVSRAPSPRTIVSGNGGTWMTVRVFPPGMKAARSSCSRRDVGLRSTYRASAAARSTWSAYVFEPREPDSRRDPERAKDRSGQRAGVDSDDGSAARGGIVPARTHERAVHAAAACPRQGRAAGHEDAARRELRAAAADDAAVEP